MKYKLENQEVCSRVGMFGRELSNTLEENGWQRSEYPDSVFVNTCSFVKPKLEENVNEVRDAMKNYPNAKIYVIGCLGRTNPERIKDISEEIIIYGRDLDEICDDLEIDKSLKISHCFDKDLCAYDRFLLYLNKWMNSKALTYRLDKSQVYHLRISEGCKGRCSYCTERLTTRLCSLPIDKVLEEFDKGLRAGYDIFSLNSDDTSCFGKDNGQDIKELLDKMLRRDNFGLAITEFNPSGLDDDIVRMLCDERIIFATIPVQSGSQKVLDRMKRGYDIERVMSYIRQIKNINPKAMINTHIITGFPGETKDDFELTRNMVRSGVFDRVKIFRYSDNENAESFNYYGKICDCEKIRRYKKLKKDVLFTSIRQGRLENVLINLKKF